MSPIDDEKLKKLLKASPSLKPPESLYRGVLEKIERGRAPAPWYFGYPMKGLATACVLVLLVIVTKETRKTQPQLFEKVSVSNASHIGTKDAPVSTPESLASSPEVQNRVNKNISDLVENPSPFEEEDAELRAKLKKKEAPKSLAPERVRANKPSLTPSPSADAAGAEEYQMGVQVFHAGRRGQSVDNFEKAVQKQQNSKEDRADLSQTREAIVENARKRSEAKAPAAAAAIPYQEQARDTASGIASQGSFLQDKGSVSVKEGNGTRALSLGTAYTVPATIEQNAGVTAAPEGAPLLGLGNRYGKAFPSTERTWQGAFSGITEPVTITIRTLAAWESLWNQHNRYITPPPPLPDVDFKTSMIIGIFAGTKPTAGYEVQIVDVGATPEKTIVRYRLSALPGGAAAAQVPTQPYQLRVIPKSNLDVVFEKVP